MSYQRGILPCQTLTHKCLKISITLTLNVNPRVPFQVPIAQLHLLTVIGQMPFEKMASDQMSWCQLQWCMSNSSLIQFDFVCLALGKLPIRMFVSYRGRLNKTFCL